MLQPDTESGLICGFSVAAGGGLHRVPWADMDGALASEAAGVWLHFNVADRRSQHFITHCAAIPAEVRGFLLERDNRARIEPMGGGLAAAFFDLRIGGDGPSETGMVRLWCSPRALITVRHVPLATLDSLRRRVEEMRNLGSTFDVLLALLHLFDDTFVRLIADLEHQFGVVEDAILAQRFTEQSGELGRLRRRIVHLRRLVNPQHHAVHALAVRPPAWIDRDAQDRIQDLADRLAAQALDLDHMAEGARLLQDEQASRLAEVTNRNLYFLAILTAIFLPMTLVTGVFGMNVAGLPGLEDDGSFWLVMLGLVATGAATLIFLRWRGMI